MIMGKDKQNSSLEDKKSYIKPAEPEPEEEPEDNGAVG